MAAELRLTVRVAAVWGLSVPAVEETLSQREVLTRLQCNRAGPILVRVYVSKATVKGPPPGPLAENPGVA